MPSMTERVCRCGAKFKARTADVKRGWGKFCSKRCKAREQEARTNGQYKRYQQSDPDTVNWGHPMAQGYEGHGQE